MKCIAFLFCLISIASSAQTKIMVATNGNDLNNGSLTQPMKTIDAAVERSRSLTGAVQILIRKGTYYLEKTIIIEAAGFKPKALELASYNDESVIISAGKKLSLKWKPYKGRIYQAEVPEGLRFERLFINGKLQVLARYPNYDSTARVFHGTASDAIAPERINTWKNPVDGYVHALHPGEWGGFHYRFTGIDENGKLKMEGGWQNNRPNKMHPDLRFVENIFEELDAPGEWFLNRKTHLLYYYPSENIDLSNVTVEVSQLKESFVFKGSLEKPLQNITISNLHFTHNERTFMDTKEPLLRSDWTIYRGGALLFDGTQNCKVTNCVLEGIGGNAIMFSNYNKNNTVSGCHIYNTGANAICFVGDASAVRSPSFRYESFVAYNQMDKTPGPKSMNYPKQCVVDNNLLHNLGDVEKQATGVQIEIASEIKVSHNSIYYVPRAGINIGDGCFGGHIIEFNDVFNTVQETGDHGAFNSWGRDRYWAPDRNYMDSLVKLHPELILLDAQKTTIIRNNRWRCDHGWDVDLDDGSSNYHIYNNVFLNGGLKFREGFYRKAENNVIVNNSFHPHVWFENSGDVFERNIVMQKYAPIAVAYWGKSINYNLFPDENSLNDARKNGTDKHSIQGDPMFIDAANGDFRVKHNSPALKIGFKNFPMNQFGVQKNSLKKLALQPKIPTLKIVGQSAEMNMPVEFGGGLIKSVQGLGERSAYGLPDETGVIIIKAGNGILAKSGLLDKDIIRFADEKPIKNVATFLDLFNSLKNFNNTISVQGLRGQQSINILLFTK